MLPKISVDPEEIIDERSEEADLLAESFVLVRIRLIVCLSAIDSVAKQHIFCPSFYPDKGSLLFYGPTS